MLYLVGFYLVYRILSIAFEDNGHEDWSTMLSIGWLGFCVYTWFAPVLFYRSLRKELTQVHLREGF
jgi:hypothetical protein